MSSDSSINQFPNPKTLILSGCARSGTSILGRIVASFRGVIYNYESPALMSLLARSQQLPKDVFLELWVSTAYKMDCVDQLAGRGLNLNIHDESSAWHYLPRDEIELRLSRSASSYDCLARFKDFTYVAKIPDMHAQIQYLLNALPNTGLLSIGRNPRDTLSSLAKKGWVDAADDFLMPMRADFDTVPCFIGDSWVERYLHAGREDRCAIWYLSVQESALASKDSYLVSYEDLVAKPEEFSESICDFLEMELGPKTQHVLNEITSKRAGSSGNFLEVIAGDLRRLIDQSWSEWQSRSRGLS